MTNILTDPKSIVPGYYLRVIGHVNSNESALKPGVYLTQHKIWFYGYGEPLPSWDSGPEAFKNAETPAYIPAGCSDTPTAAPVTMGAGGGSSASDPGPTPGGPAIIPVMGGVGVGGGGTSAPGPSPGGPGITPAPINSAGSPDAPLPPTTVVNPAPEFLKPTSHIVDGRVWLDSELTAKGWGEEQIAALPVAP